MSTIAEEHLSELARKLPAESVREVMDFAEFLLALSDPRRGNGTARGRGALRRYIGGVKHGELARGIDEELYGQVVRWHLGLAGVARPRLELGRPADGR
jgi:hypothetical protein